MRYFLSYKFTGVPLSKLYNEITPIVKKMQEHGHEVFCNLYSDDHYQRNHYTTKQIMDHCFEELKKSDVYICYVDDIFAGGMAIECGYAHSLGMPIIMCVPKNTTEKFTTLAALSTYRIDYTDHDELHHQLNYYMTMQHMIKNMK